MVTVALSIYRLMLSKRRGTLRRGRWSEVAKAPSGGPNRLLAHLLRDSVPAPFADFRIARAVAASGMVLREPPYKDRASFDQALSIAKAGGGADANEDRAAFIPLVQAMQRIASTEQVRENR